MRKEILGVAADEEGEFVLRICQADGSPTDFVTDQAWREVAEILGRRLPPRALRALYQRFSYQGQLEHAARIVGEKGQSNVSDLQRALHLGWVEALRLMEALEAAGVVVRGANAKDRPEFKVVGAGNKNRGTGL